MEIGKTYIVPDHKIITWKLREKKIFFIIYIYIYNIYIYIK